MKTFVVTLEGKCLPFQLIYGGKKSKSLPRFQFPDDFSLIVNPTHFSNADGSLEILQEIIILYLEKQRNIGSLAFGHPALLTLDVFKGQLTEPILNELKYHHIFTCQVPENMTHIYQPLDLTVNGASKNFLKAKFTEWFTKKIDEGLQEGKEPEDIEVKFRLTTLKPLHTSWVCDLYDYLTSSKGEVIIKNGWKRTGIIETIEIDLSELPLLDPFRSINPDFDQADLFFMQDTTLIYSLLDSDQLQEYT